MWVGVLPAQRSNGEGTPAWFAEGMTRRLRDELARLPDVMAIELPEQARPSPSPEATPAAAAQEIEFLVETALARDGDRLTVEASLRRVRDAQPLWHERLEYPTATTARWRDELRDRIAAALPGHRALDPRRRAGSCGDVAADDLVMHAEIVYAQYRVRDDLVRARALLDEAQARAPRCGIARAIQSMTYVSETLNRWAEDPTAAIATADRGSSEALAYSPDEFHGHFARSQVERLAGRHRESLHELERMIALDPSSGLAHGRLAQGRLESGEPEAARAEARTARRLAPKLLAAQTQACLLEAQAEFYLGREDVAYEKMQGCVALNPKLSGAWMWLAAIDARRGRMPEAAQHLERFRGLVVQSTVASLKALEPPATSPMHQRMRAQLFEALAKAGLP